MDMLNSEDAKALSRARRIIAEGQTLLVAVDSNAFFEGTGNDRRVNLHQNWMGQFRRLAKRGEILLMSSVWDVEVRRHYSLSIDSQVKVKIPKFARLGSNSKEIDKLNNRAKELRCDAQALVDKEWNSVKSSFKTELIAVPEDPSFASKVFKLWENSSWPFEGRKEKRDEFQDAFALLSIHAYAEKLRAQPHSADASILVVTADYGCRKFCEGTNSLIPCSSIDAAVTFLDQRDEILRLANRSHVLNEELENLDHPLFHHLRDSFNENQGGFPPPCYFFTVDGQEMSGWLGTVEIDSVTLLQAGPRGSKVEVIEETGDTFNITGRVRFALTISLNEPCYTEGTAMPSKESVISDYECMLDANFNAGIYCGDWFAGVSDLLRQLTPASQKTRACS